MSNQIAVDLIARDLSLSTGLQGGIAHVDRYNQSASQIKPIKLTAEVESFRQVRTELQAIQKERQAILDRGSMDWNRHQKGADQVAAQQAARNAQDIETAARRTEEAMRFQNWDPAESGRKFFRMVEMAQSANDQVKASFAKLNHDLAVEARKGMDQLAQMPAADARAFFDRISSGKSVTQMIEEEAKERRRAQAEDDNVTNQYLANRERMTKADKQRLYDAKTAYIRQTEIAMTYGIKRGSIQQWRHWNSKAERIDVDEADLDKIQGKMSSMTRVVMQATFALDDFYAGYQTGGFKQAVRGITNNLSMIGFEIGSLWGPVGSVYGLLGGTLAGIALNAGAALWDKFGGKVKETKSAVDMLNDSLAQTRQQLAEIPAIMGRDKPLAEMKRGLDRQDPEDLKARGLDVDNELKQRRRNQQLLNRNVFDMRDAFDKARDGLWLKPVHPLSKDDMLGHLRRPDLTDEQRRHLNAVLDVENELRRTEREAEDNLRQINALQKERQAITEMAPMAKQRLDDEEHQKNIEEGHRQEMEVWRMKKRLQGELHKEGQKLNKQERLDMVVANEMDPQRGVILEMKERLDLARQIADQEERAALVANVREAALLKLAKNEVAGMPDQTVGDRAAHATVIGGTADAWRTIQTANNAARQTPDTKHLSAIERLAGKQVDLLRDLVDAAAAEPANVVGN